MLLIRDSHISASEAFYFAPKQWTVQSPLGSHRGCRSKRPFGLSATIMSLEVPPGTRKDIDDTTAAFEQYLTTYTRASLRLTGRCARRPLVTARPTSPAPRPLQRHIVLPPSSHRWPAYVAKEERTEGAVCRTPLPLCTPAGPCVLPHHSKIWPGHTEHVSHERSLDRRAAAGHSSWIVCGSSMN